MQKSNMIFDAMAEAFHIVGGLLMFEGGQAGPQSVWLARSCKDWFVVIIDDGTVLVEVHSITGVAKFSNRIQQVVNCWEDVGCLGRGWEVLQCRKRESGYGVGCDV